MTKPTFYNHFKSKDALVTAVMELRSESWQRAIEERVAAARTPRRRLLAVFDFLDEFLAGQPFRGCALVNAAVEIPNPSDPGRDVARRNKADNQKRLERLAKEAGLRNPIALGAALSLLFEGAITVAFVESRTDSGRVARKAAESLIRQHTP